MHSNSVSVDALASYFTLHDYNYNHNNYHVYNTVA